MKHYLTFFDEALWLAIMGMQWIVLIQAVRRGVGKLLRAYVYLMAFFALKSAVLFGVAHLLSYLAYVRCYYMGMAIETLGLLWVLHDIFRETFAPTKSLPSGVIAKISVSIAAFGATALALTYLRPAFNESALIANARTLSRAVDAIVALAFWAIVLYARSLRIPWRTRVAGIARGFLFYLTVQAFTTAGLSFTHSQAAGRSVDRIGILAYLLSLVVWWRAIRQREAQVELPTPASVFLLKNLVAQTRSDALHLRRVAGE